MERGRKKEEQKPEEPFVEQFDFAFDDKQEGPDAKPARKKAHRINLTADSLIEKKAGLRHLQQLAKKHLVLKGEGHEFTDLKRVMELYRLWHFSLVPSFHFDYFQHKVVALSSNK